MKEATHSNPKHKNLFITKSRLSLCFSRAIFLFTHRFDKSSTIPIPPNPDRVMNLIKPARFSLIFILLIFFPFVSAIDFDMKSEFSQDETFMAKVSGNFLEPVLKENIFFYRTHVRISLEPHVVKLNNDYYLYAQLLGKSPNNYSIVIENVKYMNGSQESEEDITKEFTITNQTADFYVDPGFIFTDNDFFIEVQNLKKSEITIKKGAEAVSETSEGFFSSLFSNADDNESAGESVTLKSGEIKKINFDSADFKKSKLGSIELSTTNTKYKIPVYIFGAVEQQDREKLRFETSELNISLAPNSNITKIIYISNKGTEALENVSLSISTQLKPYLSLSLEEIGDLDANSSKKIELTISSDSLEKSVEGQLIAKADSSYAYSALFLNFVEGYIPSTRDNATISSTKTCSEMSGEICKDYEECEGELEYAKDNICCLGTCKKKEESSTGKIIGWAIVVVVVIILIWFFKFKYRGAKKKVNLLDIARGKK